MSGRVSVDEQPRASTSKEGAEPRVSLATTAYYDPLENLTAINPAELRRSVTATPATGDDVHNLVGCTSSLAKLQTYLPTGTWVTYTALQTWASSLRPGDPPTSAISNCNAHQRNALFIVLGLSSGFAFLSSFVKHFVYDAKGEHVLFPPPNLFSVAHRLTDPVTGVRFPCKTKENRYCWPLVNDAGELVYDEKGERLRILVLKCGIQIQVRRKIWWKRVWKSWFHRKENVPDAPRLHMSPVSRRTSLPSTFARYEGRENTIEIDDALATAPMLQPRWTHRIMGATGSKSYLDMRPSVWGHALVSVFSFLTLALFSTQVYRCLYPSIPDYLPSTLQTAMLILLSFTAALFVQDHTLSLGQTVPKKIPITCREAEEEIPAHLRPVADMLVWVRRQMGTSVKEG